MPRITDVHIHVQPFRMLKPSALETMRLERPDFDRFLRISDDPAALLDVLDKAGVGRACLINYVAPDVMGFTPEVNEWVLRYASADRERLIPFGSIHPDHVRSVAREADRLIKAGIGGLKVHPPHQLLFPDDPRLEPMYARAEKAGIPVTVHSGTSTFPEAKSRYGDPMHVDDVAVDHPNLKILLAHGGRPLWCEAAFFLARRHPNLYIDLSSIPPKRFLAYFPRLEEIADKILFGSDWPGPGVPSIRQEIDAVRALPLKEETIEKLLMENAKKVFPP